MNKPFVEIKDLQDFTGVYPESNNSNQELFINAAQDIIINYLGYDPRIQDRNELYNGIGENWLFLNSKPINKINEIKINNVVYNPNDFIIKSSSIIYKNGIIPTGVQNIEINYNAGFVEIPFIIKLTCLRIAAILQTESNDNIGITSKSFGDSGSRTFYNFTNFSKYLVEISKYQIY